MKLFGACPWRMVLFANLTDLQGRYGRLGRYFAHNGPYFYFTWDEKTGDIWVMDVERE